MVLEANYPLQSMCNKTNIPFKKNKVISTAGMQADFLSCHVLDGSLRSRRSVLWGAAEWRWSVAWAGGRRYCSRSDV